MPGRGLGAASGRERAAPPSATVQYSLQRLATKASLCEMVTTPPFKQSRAVLSLCRVRCAPLSLTSGCVDISLESGWSVHKIVPSPPAVYLEGLQGVRERRKRVVVQVVRRLVQRDQVRLAPPGPHRTRWTGPRGPGCGVGWWSLNEERAAILRRH